MITAAPADSGLPGYVLAGCRMRAGVYRKPAAVKISDLEVSDSQAPDSPSIDSSPAPALMYGNEKLQTSWNSANLFDAHPTVWQGVDSFDCGFNEHCPDTILRRASMAILQVRIQRCLTSTLQ